MRRTVKLAATVAVATVTLGIGPATAATGQTASTPEKSGDVHAKISHGGYSAQADGVRIRARPSTGATVVGMGYHGHVAIIHCAKNVGGSHWYYHTNRATGKKGWSAAEWMIRGQGPVWPC